MKKFYTIITFLMLSANFISAQEGKWISVMEQYNTQVMQVDVLDSLDAIALTRYAGWTEVMKSTDGGETWNLIYTEDIDKTGSPFPIPDKAYNIAHPTKDRVFIAYDAGELRRSFDGGITYDTVNFNTEESVGNLKMLDSLTGIMDVTMYMPDDFDYHFSTVILYTDDGWDTWETLRPDTIFNEPICSYDLHFFSKKHFVFTSTRADIGSMYFSTTDAGNSWTRFSFSDLINGETRCILPSIFFLDDKIGWIAGLAANDNGAQSIDVIVKTTDGGTTWELNYWQENEPIFGLQDIAFKDKMNGIATGPWGKVLRTTDGGIIWEREYAEDHSDMELHECTQVLIEYFGTKPILATAGTGAMFWKEKYPTAVKEDERFTHSIVYPNPAQAGHLLSIDIPQGKQTARIFNLQGMLIQESNVAAKSFILYPNISAGTYFLVIEADGEIIAREKFIVE